MRPKYGFCRVRSRKSLGKDFGHSFVVYEALAALAFSSFEGLNPGCSALKALTVFIRAKSRSERAACCALGNNSPA